MDDDARHAALQLGRQAIYDNMHDSRTAASVGIPEPLKIPGACFVTLMLHRELRGCIGNLEADGPLYEAVKKNAVSAAFADPRFAPLSLKEFPEIRLEISVLSPLAPLPIQDKADLVGKLGGRPGLVLEYLGHKATFLPRVWDSLPDPAEFVDALLQKAHLTFQQLSDPELKAYTYTAEEFGEPA